LPLLLAKLYFKASANLPDFPTPFGSVSRSAGLNSQFIFRSFINPDFTTCSSPNHPTSKSLMLPMLILEAAPFADVLSL